MRLLSELAKDLHLPKPPFWMVSAVIVLVVLTWVPLAMIARARVTPSSQPRIHLFQDMDDQPRYGPQKATPLFRDGRAMRIPVAGTVARGQLNQDDHYNRGYAVTGVDDHGAAQIQYFAGMPDGITVDADFMARGQDMYNVYCFTCHGMSGKGDGPTDHRAKRLAGNPLASLGTVWTTPANLVAVEDGQLKYGPQQHPDGQLYNVITNGFNTMPAYGDQIAVEDRWAIVAYIRALQVSQYDPNAQSSEEGG